MYPFLHHRLGIRNIRDTASGKRSREHNKVGAGGIKRSYHIDYTRSNTLYQ